MTARSPLDVPCPTCGQAKGDRCATIDWQYSKSVFASHYHRARVRAAKEKEGKK